MILWLLWGQSALGFLNRLLLPSQLSNSSADELGLNALLNGFDLQPDRLIELGGFSP